MNLIARLIVVAGVGLGTYVLSYWPANILLYSAFRGHNVFLNIAANVLCLLLAFGASRMIWRRLCSADLGWISCIFIGAVLFGGIGFAVGYFGPLILDWGGNLGPLLGILYTGPIGVVLGAISGFVYNHFWNQQHSPNRESAK